MNLETLTINTKWCPCEKRLCHGGIAANVYDMTTVVEGINISCSGVQLS